MRGVTALVLTLAVLGAPPLRADPPASPAPTPAPAAGPAEAGLDALDAGDFERAFRLLEEAVAAEPDDAFLAYALGVAAVHLGRDVAAASALRRGAELDPELPGVQAELGLALARLGELEAAEGPLLEALVQGPEDADVLVALGRIDVARGETARAERLFAEAAIVDPARAAAPLYRAAGVALDRGDLEEAIARLERAAAAPGPASARARAEALLAALRPPAPKRIGLSAGAGVEYDDNLTVSPVDLTTGLEDVAGVFDAHVDLYAIRRSDLQVSVGYDFFQSVYRQTSALDLQSHSPFVQVAAGEGRIVGLGRYRYTRDDLGGDGFLSTHRGDLEAEIEVVPFVIATLGTRLERLAFDQAPRRDAQRLAVGLGVRLADPEAPVSLELDYQRVFTDARGPEFDYRGHVVGSALTWALEVRAHPVDFRLSHDWDGRDYDHPTPRIATRRRDSRHLFGAGVSTPLIGPTDVSLDYLHVSSRSNLPELNYGEDIVTLRIGAYY